MWYALPCCQGDQNSAFPLGDFSFLSLSLSLSLCTRLFPCRISSLVAPNLSFLLVLFVTFFLYFFCNKSIRVTLTGE